MNNQQYEFKGSQPPWICSINDDGNPCVEIKQRTGWVLGAEYICEEMFQNDNALEDATLIAAAPDLLEACKMALKYIDHRLTGADGDFQFDNDAHVALRQSIHKALNIQ